MVHIRHVAALAFLGLVTQTVAQKLTKPPLLNSLDQLWGALEPKLTKPPGEIKQWPPTVISQDCKKMCEREGVPVATMVQYEITYDDCAQPWQICVAKDHPTPTETIAKFLGMVPVKLRQATKHAAFFKPKTAKSTAAAYALGDQLAFMVELKSIGIFLHEISHTADLGSRNSHFDKVKGRFAEAKKWTDAIEKDKAISDAYGQNSKHENLAQYAGLVLYDILVDGGLAKIIKDIDKIANQIKAFKQATTNCRHGGNMLKLDQKCTSRKPNSKPVAGKKGSPKMRMRMRARGDELAILLTKNYTLEAQAEFAAAHGFELAEEGEPIEKRGEPTACGAAHYYH